MNILIITCSCPNNFGAVLQTFALSRYLIDLGHIAHVIDYRPPYLEFSTRQWYNPRFNIKEWGKVILRWQHRKLQIAKYEKIRIFSNEEIPFTANAFHSVDELQTSSLEADLYIAGSDQIWNPLLPNGSDSAFFLNFGLKKGKRISYAASFGVDTIPPRFKNIILEGLKNFDAISVREETGQEICREYGFKSIVTTDPVFLHSYDFWSHKADISLVTDQPYLLVYDLMNSGSINRVAKIIARNLGLKIFSVSPYRICYANKNYGSCTPQQFIGLILNAHTVLSNSLHGCIFSMIFRKNFFVMDREDGMNMRIHELLKRYHLLDRLITDLDPDCQIPASINFSAIDEDIRNDIKKSKDWLEQQLNFN